MKESGEEKLLKLIRGTKKETQKPLEPGQPKKSSTKIGIKQIFFRLPLFRVSFNAEKLFFLCMILSIVYTLIMFAYPLLRPAKSRVRDDLSRQEVLFEKTEAVEKAGPQDKSLDYYTQGLGRRQMFSASATQGSASTGVLAAANSDIIKNINLVGIISGDNPQAIIEDKNTNKSYYLSEGQSIGEVKVERIQEGKVILSYNGQTYELYL